MKNSCLTLNLSKVKTTYTTKQNVVQELDSTRRSDWDVYSMAEKWTSLFNGSIK
jgi:hypothetical protein